MNDLDNITDSVLSSIISEIEVEPNDETEALRAFNKAESRIRTIERRRRCVNMRKMLCRAAAILLIPVSIALVLSLVQLSKGEEWAELVVPNGVKQTVTLADGSKLAINAGSRITYPSKFTGKSREIFLDGQVVADIASNPRRPFVIHTSQLDVKVLGTEFELKAYSNSNVADLHLFKGSVLMSSSKCESQMVVQPGEYVQYDKKLGTLNKTSFSLSEYKTFMESGTIMFNKVSLRDACEELERIFGKQIVITDEKLASRMLFAFFSNGESLDLILKALVPEAETHTDGDVMYLSPNS